MTLCESRLPATIVKISPRLRSVAFDPSWAGGICHYTFALCNSIGLQGAEVSLITSESYELEEFDRDFRLLKLLHHKSTIPGSSTKSRVLRRLPTRVLFELNARNVLQQVVALRPNVFHVQGLLNANFEPSLWKRIADQSIPVVFTVHDVFPHETGSVAGKNLARLYASADHLIVHSLRAKQSLVEGWQVPESRVSVIPMGNYRFIADRWIPEPAECRRDFDIPESSPVVLFFGFLREYKGLDVLIDAFARLVGKRPEARLIIAGGHWGQRWEDTPYAGQIRKYELEEAVRVRSDYIPLDKVAHYFAASDLVALPYRRGSGSAVVQLAYAFGKPVVATDTGGFPEVVEIGRTGLIVPPENIEAFADALDVMTADRERTAVMGSTARDLAETQFAWSAISAQTIELYRRIVETR